MALYESGEMYLETILVLYKRGLERVRAIDIVKEMNFSKPSVSIALSNLKKEGYVTVDANGTVELTDSGSKSCTSTCVSWTLKRNKQVLYFYVYTFFRQYKRHFAENVTYF